MSENDLLWYLFFRRHRRTLRRVFSLAFALLFVAGFVYAVIMLRAISGRGQ